MADRDDALDRMHIASPCPADWSRMRGDDASRVCGLCQRRVHDLAALSEERVARLVRRVRRGEVVCVRLYRRADGKVMTADCEHRRREQRRGVYALIAGAVFGFLALVGLARDAARSGEAWPLPWWLREPPAPVRGPIVMGSFLERPEAVPAADDVIAAPAPDEEAERE